MSEEETPQQTTGRQTFLKTLTTTILNKIALTGDGITKTDSWDGDTLMDGDGVLVAEILDVYNAKSGLPDYFITVSLVGMTQVSTDTDQEIIRKMFAETLNSVCALRTTDFPSGCCGILQTGKATPRSDDDRRTFSLEFKLVFTEITF